MHSVTPEHAVKVLNEALKADQATINKMFANRIVCTEALSNHETIQVRAYEHDGDPGEPNIGMLGLINGIFGINPGGWGFIVMEIDTKTHQIERFSLRPD